MAGGRLLAGEVPDEPAPLHLEAATPGPAIGLRSRRQPAGVPAGAGSPTGGVRVLRVRREVERRLTPGRSRRRGRRGQLGCVGLPDNRAVALDGVGRRTLPTRWMSAWGGGKSSPSLQLKYSSLDILALLRILLEVTRRRERQARRQKKNWKAIAKIGRQPRGRGNQVVGSSQLLGASCKK